MTWPLIQTNIRPEDIMAIYKTDAVKSDVKPDRSDAGVLLCRTGEYTADGAMAAANVIQMVPVPEGAKIVDIKIMADASTAATLDVGDGNDTDRFFDGLDGTSAVAAGLVADGAGIDAINYVYEADDTIDILVKTGSVDDETEIKMVVFYIMTGSIADEG